MEFATYFKMTLVVSMLVMSVSGLHGQGSSAYNAAKGPKFGRRASEAVKGGNSKTNMVKPTVASVNGGWSVDFGPCSGACGGGAGTKSKTCNNPEKKGDGKPCQGAGTASCTNEEDCPEGANSNTMVKPAVASVNGGKPRVDCAGLGCKKCLENGCVYAEKKCWDMETTSEAQMMSLMNSMVLDCPEPTGAPTPSANVEGTVQKRTNKNPVA